MSPRKEEAPESMEADRALGIASVSADILSEGELIDKRFATLRAELALHNFALSRLSNGFLVARWDRTAYMPDLAGVEVFLARCVVHNATDGEACPFDESTMGWATWALRDAVQGAKHAIDNAVA